MQHEQLMDCKNVVGVGEIGAEARPDTLDAEVHDPTQAGSKVAVLVTQKETEDYLRDEDLVPTEIDGKPTDVFGIGGRIRPQPEPLEYSVGADTYPERDTEWEYLTGGLPVRPEGGSGRGTVFPAFWSSDYRNPVILSNRHVMVNWDRDDRDPEVGDAIYHGDRKIAELADWTEEVHPDDGVTPGDDAIAELTDEARERWQGGLLGFDTVGEPQVEASDDAGDRDTMHNSGYRTSTTSSLVFITDASLTVTSRRFEPDDDDEDAPDLKYEDVLTTFAMTLGGDSGSPTGHANAHADTLRPGYIHFAGSSAVSAAHPLDRVLEQYSFEGWYEGDADVPADGDDDPEKPDAWRLRKWLRGLFG